MNMNATTHTGEGHRPIIIQHKTRTLPAAIVALAVIALLGIVLILGGIVLLALLVPAHTPDRSMEARFVAGDAGAANRAALIRIEGVITDQDDRLFGRGEGLVARVRKRLERAGRDQVKAVILEVNSPGGGITASELIRNEILAFKKEHPSVPVVVQMLDLAASGGYYVSAPADWIVAMPTTLTASIGVILVHENLTGLFDQKLGIRTHNFVSGRHKDILSPFRDMTEEEKSQIQGIVDEMFERFLNVVLEGRGSKVTAEQIRALEGTVLTGPQAREKGLVDQLGTLDDAVAKAAELAKVKTLRVVRYEKPSTFLEEMLSVRLKPEIRVGPVVFDPGEHVRRGGSPFLYLWRL
jgi:protease IV